MEVLLTIALVGMSLAPAFIMVSSTMRPLYAFSRRLQLLFPIKNFWVSKTSKVDPSSPVLSSVEGPDKSAFKTKEITRPTGTLTYKLTPVGEKSALKKIKGMHRAEVIGRSRNTKETLVGFVYRPEKKKQ